VRLILYTGLTVFYLYFKKMGRVALTDVGNPCEAFYWVN
jgi:hypothetical protein